MLNALECPGVVGDGRHDDSAGLQAALDTKAATVHLPRPSGHYLIRQTLVVDSGQTLIADRNAIIRLGDHAHCHMLTNANHDQESCGITVTGGIWDGNNVHQTCEYHENGGKWQVPYDFNVVSFTNHRVHPGSPSTFDDISIDSVFCSKSAKGMNLPSGGPFWSGLSPIWIDAPADVSSLAVHNYHRTESAVPTADIFIEPGARVEHLALSDVALLNRCASPVHLLHNHGSIGSLSLLNIDARADGAGVGGRIVRNDGSIERVHQANASTVGFECGV